MLGSGDIVFVPAIDTPVYYTGGLLPSREVPLPRGYDLAAVEAVLRVGGPLMNGGFNSNNISGELIPRGLGGPSPSQLTILRRTIDGRQVAIHVDLNRAIRDPRENLLVKNGDVLILQQNSHEAISRYLSQVMDFNFIGRFVNRQDATGTFTITMPFSQR